MGSKKSTGADQRRAVNGRSIRTQAGQIVVEYLLLLVIVVSLSALIIRQLASRDDQNPGVLIDKWNKIQIEIGKDLPDKCVSNSDGACN
jgi:hypothetical protein